MEISPVFHDIDIIEKSKQITFLTECFLTDSG